jgi:hypothetical protein
MKARLFIALATAFMLAVPSMAAAQVPAEVPVQGFLTDDQGVPVDGSVSVEFKVYDAATGGAELHTQSENVSADAGAFTVQLTPDLTIFENNTDLYLGMAVDGGAEMSPRLKMGSVPYAAVAGNAQNALTLDGQSASDFAPSTYQPDWSDVQNAPTGLDDGDDDTTYTASGAVSIDGSNNITLNSSCSSGQVLKWSGSAWACATDEDSSTTYTAGSGLALNGNTFSVDTITDTHIANSSISPFKISNGGAATLSGGAFFRSSIEVRDNLDVRGEIATNSSASDVLSYYRFRDSSGSSGPRFFHLSTTDEFELRGASTGLSVSGDVSASGTKNFIQPHPTDPTKQIRYSALEGGEAGVYARGTVHTENGRAVIDLPKHFQLVASPGDLTTNIVPRDGWAPLYVEEVSPDQLIVAVDDRFGDGDVEFDYTVTGVRKHMEHRPVIVENVNFRPEIYTSLKSFAKEMSQHEHIKKLLIENGVLNADGTTNQATIERLGWSADAE